MTLFMGLPHDCCRLLVWETIVMLFSCDINNLLQVLLWETRIWTHRKRGWLFERYRKLFKMNRKCEGSEGQGTHVYGHFICSSALFIAIRILLYVLLKRLRWSCSLFHCIPVLFRSIIWSCPQLIIEARQTTYWGGLGLTRIGVHLTKLA